jgi:drug/metabolite transporter (DMT)-like permease
VSAIIAWFWIREKPTRRVMIASIFALFGVMIIVIRALDSIHLSRDLLALWMTIGMAVY